MKAKDIMTKDVLKIDKDERLARVLDMMVKHRVSKLVVTENSHAVGVITDGDIADDLGAIKNRGVPASQLHASSVMRRRFPTATPEAPVAQILDTLLHDDAGLIPIVHDEHPVGVVTTSDLLPLVKVPLPVRQVMTSQLHVVSPTDRVIHARRLMVDHHVERLPVLDHGNLVGILGEIDVALGLARLKDSVSENHQTAALQRFRVDEVMQRNPITATPEMPATDAIALMRQNDVGSLPLLTNGRIQGIVTRGDLIRLIPR